MVKQGYKQTEIGVIPEDWDYGVFSSFVKLRHGFQFLEHHFSLSGVPVIKIGTLKDSGGIDVNKFTFVSEEIFEKFKSIQLFKGDVVMALTGATLGKVSKVDYNERCLQNYRVGLFNGIVGVDNNFIYHILQSFLVQKTVKELVNSGAQPNLGKADFDKIIIPLPPLPEQEAIAEALSDADAWIESLEQLIAKKRLIKQGAMQELLTPPSPSSGNADGEALEPWEVKKLGEVAEIYQPQTISNSAFTSDGYLVYGANGIIGKYHSYNHKLWQITITCRGSTCGTVNKTIEKVWITGNAMVVNVDNNASINKLFLYYLLSSYDFSNCITGSGQPQIVRSPLIDYIVYLPSLSEQTRIATILSDMDAELEALEQKLSKARQIKQGMMQELLTGRTRLV